MKKIILATVLLLSFPALTMTQAAEAKRVSVADQNQQTEINKTEINKKIVTDFYEGVFLKHQVKEYADRYIGSQYIQHNPHVPDGKEPFVNYFTQYFKEKPQAKNSIKRVIADGDLVALHVHSVQNNQDLGEAIVDIFRVENGKIVEHWDVIQPITISSANTNTMF